ncbi:MAG: MMPL family transporter [Candidatus Latescibacteria bacterium]|nr:MMPL family transporter [bacterium]MBD3423333.1 MMPL family transporter [Candidatus Latescibacterota bacterium]
MEKLTRFSVNQPVTVLMFILAVILLGVISFQRLGVEIMPDLNNPSLFVELEAGERPPSEMENLYIEQIESIVSRQSGVSEVESEIRTGAALISVSYGWGTDMDNAFLELQKAVNDLAQQFELDEISITQYDPNAEPIMTLAMYHPDITDMNEIRRIAENYLRNELIRIDGIADVQLSGQEEKELVIETDRYLLDAYGVTTSQISSRIRNFNQDISGGSVLEMGQKYIIKGVGIFESVDDVRNLVLDYRQDRTDPDQGKTAIYLKDVATVLERNRDPENIVRINGIRCVGLGIYKETRFNTVEAVQKLTGRLEQIRRALPGYRLIEVENRADYVVSAITEVEQTALIGIILAVIVLFVFLRRIGTTAVISIAIPISVIATFTLMYFNSLSINIMTLGGLALGAGMLVDNAIVVVENIVRNMEEGLDPREASVRGTAQIFGAITAATVTTIVVFLPIVYIHGVAGELFKDQALTVTFALLSSLVVALLVIPMLSSRTLKKNSAVETAKQISFSRYGKLLAAALRKRYLVIAAAAVLVATSALLLPLVGSEFIPDTRTDEFSLDITLPPGTGLNRCSDAVDRIAERAREILGDEIEMVYSIAGPVRDVTSEETGIFRDENTARVKIILAGDARSGSLGAIDRLSGRLSENPELEIQFLEDQSALSSITGTSSAPIVIEVSGEELDSLQAITGRIKNELMEMDELFNLETSFEQGRPELEIHPDRLRAGVLGIGVSDIASQLRDRLIGTEVDDWNRAGEKLDITLKYPDATLADLENFVLEKGGQRVLLKEVASITRGFAPQQIRRRSQKRLGEVTAYYREGTAFNRVIAGIENRLERVSRPSDYSLEIRGEEYQRRESFGDLKFALILSVILVYMVLASQFESLIHPFTILLTIPLAGVGAVLIFLVTGKPLSIMAYIGIIMLAGIAVNDSIILVDRINRIKRSGLDRNTAIITGARERIRPIVMTSVTTILALLPLTFGFGESAALRAPMALAVIGGLFTSTLLTLVVIPCVYSVLDRD